MSNLEITDEIREILYKNQRKYYANNKVAIREYAKRKRREVLLNRTHHCDSCNKSFYDKTSLNSHLRTKKHNPELYVNYKCPFSWCNYQTRVKSRFTKHMNTRKHVHINAEALEWMNNRSNANNEIIASA